MNHIAKGFCAVNAYPIRGREAMGWIRHTVMGTVQRWCVSPSRKDRLLSTRCFRRGCYTPFGPYTGLDLDEDEDMYA